MAKHKAPNVRDVVALGPEPAVAIIVEPKDLPLLQRLLTFYANETYLGGRDSHRWRGYSMHHFEARELADKIKRVRGAHG